MGSNELGELLRARRAEVAPRSVGLSPLSTRRSAGLTRGDVAELAGISESYYARIERGRCVPSESVVDAIANVLRLEADDRAQLFRIVDSLGTTANEVDLRGSLDTLADGAAAVLEFRTDGSIVGWNGLAELLFANFALLSERQRTLGALVGAREGHLSAHAEVAKITIDIAFALHALADEVAAARDFKITIATLLMSVPGFGTAWDAYDGSPILPTRFWHPSVGELQLSCAASMSDPLRRTTLRFSPATPETSDALILLEMTSSQ